jgi:hypothetical protein
VLMTAEGSMNTSPNFCTRALGLTELLRQMVAEDPVTATKLLQLAKSRNIHGKVVP